MKDKRGRGSVYLEIYGGLLFVALRMAALSPESEPAIVNIVGVPPAPCTRRFIVVKDSARIPVLGELSLLTWMAYRRSFMSDLGARASKGKVRRAAHLCNNVRIDSEALIDAPFLENVCTAELLTLHRIENTANAVDPPPMRRDDRGKCQAHL